jgi:cytochrome c biogenesis protein CcdA
MLRTIGGILLGVVAAFAAIWCVEMVGHIFYPIPSDVTLNDGARLRDFIRSMPVAAQLFVLAAWFLGALVGGLVAALVSRRRWTAWLIAGLVAIGGLINIFWIPHPELLQVGSVVGPLLGGLFASQLARRSLAGPAPLGEAV